MSTEPTYGEVFAEHELELEHESTHESEPRVKTPSRALESGLLILTGFAASGGAVAMLNAKQFSWTLYRFSRDLDRLGISKGSLIMGGLVLIGVGMAIRAAAAAARVAASTRGASAAPQPVEPTDHGVELENLQANVGLLQDGLEQTQQELSALVAGQQQMLAQVASLAQADKQGADEIKKGQNDALFRLAASMDKIGQRLEETIKSGIEPLQQAVESIPASIEERLVAVPVGNAGSAPTTHTQVDEDEEMTVLVDFEDDGSDDVDFEALSQDLGLLDKLDQLDQLDPQHGQHDAENPSAPARDGLASLDFDKLDLEAAEQAPPAALPKQQAPRPPIERPAPPQYGDLDSLLPDSRVDEAIDRQRHDG